jgi:uncharacterized Zn finger protein (UPF0148 family)
MTIEDRIKRNMELLRYMQFYHPHCPECGYYVMEKQYYDGNTEYSIDNYKCPNCQHKRKLILEHNTRIVDDAIIEDEIE